MLLCSETLEEGCWVYVFVQNNRLGCWAELCKGGQSPSYALHLGKRNTFLDPFSSFPLQQFYPCFFSVCCCSVLLLRLLKCSFHVEEEIFNLLINNLGLGFQPFKMQTWDTALCRQRDGQDVCVLYWYLTAFSHPVESGNFLELVHTLGSSVWLFFPSDSLLPGCDWVGGGGESTHLWCKNDLLFIALWYFLFSVIKLKKHKPASLVHRINAYWEEILFHLSVCLFRATCIGRAHHTILYLLHNRNG